MFRRSILILALTIVASTTISAAAAVSSHYEKPPCENSDEKAVQIMGIDGMFCSASCKDSPCPSDTPDGVTATPSCALQSPEGDKYCAILCSPTLKNGISTSGGDGECGPMMCQPVPQAAGMGICTYTSRSIEEEEEEPAMIFMEEVVWMMTAEE